MVNNVIGGRMESSSLIISHAFTFFAGAFLGAVTYKISVGIIYKGGVTQKGNTAGGDIVAGNKVERK